MPNPSSPWGPGFQAAVSLTYDDGIANHLDLAMPMLEAHGFRGTFYLITAAGHLAERRSDWQAAFRRGHEIGNHTARHPGWDIRNAAPDAPRLEQFGPADIEREVGEAADWLDQAIGPDPGRTFAYPYAQNFIGPDRRVEPYLAAVRRHCAGSRLGGGTSPNPPQADPYTLRGFSFGAGATAEQLIGYCEQARQAGGWAILDFHGVGGPWIETPAEAHRRLLAYLAERPFRVAPVRDLLGCLRPPSHPPLTPLRNPPPGGP